jgi:hypothetical protein
LEACVVSSGALVVGTPSVPAAMTGEEVGELADVTAGWGSAMHPDSSRAAEAASDSMRGAFPRLYWCLSIPELMAD